MLGEQGRGLRGDGHTGSLGCWYLLRVCVYLGGLSHIRDAVSSSWLACGHHTREAGWLWMSVLSSSSVLQLRAPLWQRLSILPSLESSSTQVEAALSWPHVPLSTRPPRNVHGPLSLVHPTSHCQVPQGPARLLRSQGCLWLCTLCSSAPPNCESNPTS